jgi:hypothetical protein
MRSSNTSMTAIKEMNKIANILLLSLLLAGCSQLPEKHKGIDHTSLPNKETQLELPVFVKWVENEENELVKNKTISEINYQVAFLPCDYLAYTELKNEDYTPQQFEQTKKNYEGMSYFKLRIEVKEHTGELLKYALSSARQYNERISYMAFRMQQDLFLVQGKDTLYPGLYHFERAYDLAPFADVMLAFDNAKFHPENEFTIVYNDRLFNKGYIKYIYRQKQLIDLPIIPNV